jgi:hypothetical protein
MQGLHANKAFVNTIFCLLQSRYSSLKVVEDHSGGANTSRRTSLVPVCFLLHPQRKVVPENLASYRIS